MEEKLKRNSLYVKLVFFLLTAAIIFQLFHIQILEYNKWNDRSIARQELRETYEASRGRVYFSDGSPLAINEPAFGVFVETDSFDKEKAKKESLTKEIFSKEVSTILGVDEKTILDKISNPKIKYVSIANKINQETVDKINEKVPRKLNIWSLEKQSKRVYPDNELASKIIGFLGKDEDGNDIGRYGIEEYFDGVLKGTLGLFEGKKDSNNNVIVNEKFDNVEPKDGIDLTLTIDKNLQVVLEDRMLYWFDKFKSKSATAVVMEPDTGRILALADFPTYNPNEYWKGEKVYCNYEYYLIHVDCNKKEEVKPADQTAENGTSTTVDNTEKNKENEAKKAETEDKTKQEEIDPRIANYSKSLQEIFRKESLSPAEVYRDSANSFTYEPGSVIKVITLAIAYQYGTIPTDPNYPLGGHKGCEYFSEVKLCTAQKQPKASLSVKEMLRDSDNIGAIRVAQTVPLQKFADTLTKFGLGNTTGVELADESRFIMKNKEDWTSIDGATAAFGQGSVGFTPIQLTNAWNIIASKGKSYKPTIVKEINDNGKIKKFDPEFLSQVVSEHAAVSASNVSGEAVPVGYRKAEDFQKKYSFAGKTGTANIPSKDNKGYLEGVVNTSFVGFAPLNNPKFTMLIWFREPRLGIDKEFPNGINTAETAWLDIAEKLAVKMNIAPKE